MKNLVFSILSIILFASCQSTEKNSDQFASAEAQSSEKWKGFHKIEPTAIKDNAIQLIGKEWMLVTSGNEASFNTMTASWGGLGEIWSKPVSMITIRDSRYTYEFLQKNEYYTLTFFPPRLKDKLSMLGSKSGRDTDKVKESGLTPIVMPTGSMSFGEARMILECRKIYASPFVQDSIFDKSIIEKTYANEPSMHTLYIGEIVNVWVK